MSPSKPDSSSEAGSAPVDPVKRRLHAGVKEVYRDEVLWVLDKPGGLLSHPNNSEKAASNIMVRAPYDVERECFRIGGGREERNIFLVHRLDLETSGLIICTFHPEAAAILKEALFNRDVHKEYRALVLGRVRGHEGTWEDNLQKSKQRGRVEVRVHRGAKANASTDYRVQRVYPDVGVSLLSLFPNTGRTHQLRVQTSSRALPIAGDDRYGDFKANKFLQKEIGLKRMFLHASRLEFRHPMTGKRLKLTCGLSRRLSEPLAKLDELLRPVPRRQGNKKH